MTTNIQKINGKTFLVPEYNLQGYEQFFLPKLEFKGMQHVYFNPDEINQVYKQQNIDPDNLDCNLKYDADKDTQPFVPPARLPRQDSVPKEQEAVKVEQKKEEVVEEEVRGKPKPKSREKGYTHFIQIPLIDACRESFDNVIKSVIDANDQDSLVSRNSLHVTVMVLRLRSEEDLPKWKRIL